MYTAVGIDNEVGPTNRVRLLPFTTGIADDKSWVSSLLLMDTGHAELTTPQMFEFQAQYDVLIPVGNYDLAQTTSLCA